MFGRLSTRERWAIIEARESGAQTVRQLSQAYHVSTNTIRALQRKYEETGTIVDRPRTGRPRKVTPALAAYLVQEVRRTPRVTSDTLRERLAQVHGVVVHHSTIRLHLSYQGIHKRRSARFPTLTPALKEARLHFGQTHLQWPLSTWKKVIWTDEATFCLRMQDDRRVMVWRRSSDDRYDERFVVPTVHKGGPSLMVWAAISWSRKSFMVFLDSITADDYLHQVLEEVGLPFAQAAVGDEYIWMQDNAPVHKARIVQQYLQGVTQLPWPAVSPDLNPIEKMWDFLRTRVAKRIPRPVTLDDLRVALAHEWDSIPMYYVHNLIRSMHRRCQAVVDAQGGPTKY